MRKIEDWFRSAAKSPADRIMKARLKGMVASEPAPRGISPIQPIERYGLAT